MAFFWPFLFSNLAGRALWDPATLGTTASVLYYLNRNGVYGDRNWTFLGVLQVGADDDGSKRDGHGDDEDPEQALQQTRAFNQVSENGEFKSGLGLTFLKVGSLDFEFAT